MRQREANAPLTRQLFLLALCLVFLLAAGNFGAGLTQSPKERKVKTRTFHGMPLKVKEVRNLQKGEDEWFRDLEIEVENISDRPIYFISLMIEFPNIPAPPPQMRPDGITPARTTTGFGLTYGAWRLLDVSRLATPEDVPLEPGETYVFKIPDSRVLGLEHIKRTESLPHDATDKLDLEFDTISFGDGTGYIAGEKRVYPKKKEE